MSNALRLSSCLLLVATLAACNKSEPAAPADTAQASAPTATAPASAASTAAAQAPATAATPADDESVALDMDKVKAYMQAQMNLAHAAEANPKMGDPAQNMSEENVTQYAARLDADPTMHAAIASAGLSTRDFARIGDTLLGAMMTEGALEGGQLKKIPDGIDPASVEFVKQHKAEINKLFGAKAG